MYANTAYEALYQLMGLKLQEEVTRWLTSQVIFRAALLMIFGFSFFLFLLHYASRFIPGWLSPKQAPVSKLIGILFGLFLGISILKVGADESSLSMNGTPWSQNPYITSNSQAPQDSYHVSLIFKLLSGSAEELSRSLGFIVDSTFKTTNSQMTAPNFFYKAILGAATDTLDDPGLKSRLNYYTERCLSQIIPRFDPSGNGSISSAIDQGFSSRSDADGYLSQISLLKNQSSNPLEPSQPQSSSVDGPSNCLELKQSINEDIHNYVRARSPIYQTASASTDPSNLLSPLQNDRLLNLASSEYLVNHYLESQEGAFGLNKAAEIPGTAGRIAQFFSANWTDSLLRVIPGQSKNVGITLAAARQQELSDHLARAAHVAGFLKLFLIGFFPILVFFLAAGHFKPIAWWWLTYLSICLWTPLWALTYHVITALQMSKDTLEQFGNLNDGLSLYAANLLSARFYQAYVVYAYLQLAIGPAFTGSLLWFMRGFLVHSEAAPMPEIPGHMASTAATATNIAKTAATVVSVV